MSRAIRVPFVPSPQPHGPSRGAYAECDRYFSSLRLGNARLGGIGCGLFVRRFPDPDKIFTDTRIHRAPDCAITWRERYMFNRGVIFTNYIVRSR